MIILEERIGDLLNERDNLLKMYIKGILNKLIILENIVVSIPLVIINNKKSITLFLANMILLVKALNSLETSKSLKNYIYIINNINNEINRLVTHLNLESSLVLDGCNKSQVKKQLRMIKIELKKYK